MTTCHLTMADHPKRRELCESNEFEWKEHEEKGEKGEREGQKERNKKDKMDKETGE